MTGSRWWRRADSNRRPPACKARHLGLVTPGQRRYRRSGPIYGGRYGRPRTSLCTTFARRSPSPRPLPLPACRGANPISSRLPAARSRPSPRPRSSAPTSPRRPGVVLASCRAADGTGRDLSRLDHRPPCRSQRGKCKRTEKGRRGAARGCPDSRSTPDPPGPSARTSPRAAASPGAWAAAARRPTATPPATRRRRTGSLASEAPRATSAGACEPRNANSSEASRPWSRPSWPPTIRSFSGPSTKSPRTNAPRAQAHHPRPLAKTALRGSQRLVSRRSMRRSRSESACELMPSRRATAAWPTSRTTAAHAASASARADRARSTRRSAASRRRRSRPDSSWRGTPGTAGTVPSRQRGDNDVGTTRAGYQGRP
jgi:hypothetical protein